MRQDTPPDEHDEESGCAAASIARRNCTPIPAPDGRLGVWRSELVGVRPVFGYRLHGGRTWFSDA